MYNHKGNEYSKLSWLDSINELVCKQECSKKRRWFNTLIMIVSSSKKRSSICERIKSIPLLWTLCCESCERKQETSHSTYWSLRFWEFSRRYFHLVTLLSYSTAITKTFFVGIQSGYWLVINKLLPADNFHPFYATEIFVADLVRSLITTRCLTGSRAVIHTVTRP